MNILQLLLNIDAGILLALAGFGGDRHRLSVGWLGLLCWLLAAVFVPMLT